jgi:hypothetical protein
VCVLLPRTLGALETKLRACNRRWSARTPLRTDADSPANARLSRLQKTSTYTGGRRPRRAYTKNLHVYLKQSPLSYLSPRPSFEHCATCRNLVSSRSRMLFCVRRRKGRRATLAASRTSSINRGVNRGEKFGAAIANIYSIRLGGVACVTQIRGGTAMSLENSRVSDPSLTVNEFCAAERISRSARPCSTADFSTRPSVNSMT